MSKLIIENRTDLKMSEAMIYAREVVLQGKISETSKGKQYCFCTLFEDSKIVVYADLNKKSDRLIVCPDWSKPMK